eukprot:g3443.t1
MGNAAAWGMLTGRSKLYGCAVLFAASKLFANIRAARGANPLRGLKYNMSLLDYILALVLPQKRRGTLAGAVLGDILGLALLWRGLALKASAMDFVKLPRRQKFDLVGGILVNASKGLPFVKEKIKKEHAKSRADLRVALKGNIKEEARAVTRELPMDGRDDESLLRFMGSLIKAEDKMWQDGYVSGAVYHGEAEHLQCLNKVYGMYSITNPLHPDIWPSTMKYEAEIVAMTANFVSGGTPSVCGCLTSGGTESILMAVKAHREWGLREKGIVSPEMIIPSTAHAAFDKAAETLCIKLIKLPVSKKTFAVNPAHVAARMNANTILIVGSAPNFPNGTIDPIEALSKLAKSHGVGLHVDCCLGGFFLPFARELRDDIPKFDFSLPGVTSMSCDTHKYGYAAKGTSVVLLRDHALRQHMYFTYADWSGGFYCTPTMQGSRAGALSAACWASMMRLGKRGYLEATEKILAVREFIQRAIMGIDGISVCGDPVAMVISWQSKTLNVYNVQDAMSKKGWHVNSTQRPPCGQICLTYRHTLEGVKEKFVADLRDAVAEVKSNPSSSKSGGSASMYGTSASLPKGSVDDVLAMYMDLVLQV